MPRKKLIRTKDFPYHVITRTNNKNWFELEMGEVWTEFIEALNFAIEHHPAKLHAFVLMNNHYHLLLTTPNEDIDYFMQKLNKKFSDGLRAKTNRINRMFSGPYKWSIVNNYHYLCHVYRYIYQNPQRAGLVEKVEHYPYSSLSFSLGEKSLDLPLDFSLEYDVHSYLDWFNERVVNNEVDAVRGALRSSYFKLAKANCNKVKMTLEKPKMTHVSH